MGRWRVAHSPKIDSRMAHCDIPNSLNVNSDKIRFDLL